MGRPHGGRPQRLLGRLERCAADGRTVQPSSRTSASVRATTQPPKPARSAGRRDPGHGASRSPARRAPGSTLRSRRAGSCGSRSSAAGGDDVAGPERLGEPAHALVLGDHMARPRADGRVGDVGTCSREASRSGPMPLGGFARSPSLGVGGQRASVARQSRSRPRRGRRGSGPATREVVQSISSASPSTPTADASWSMIPHGTPEARCSAGWHSRAMSSGGRRHRERARPPPRAPRSTTVPRRSGSSC